jgi:hypothetical protein
MSLSVDVLDDVLNEIGRGQDVRATPLMTAIQSLSDADLIALGELCQMSGHSTFEQVWELRRLSLGALPETRPRLEANFKKFTGMGLIAEEDGIIRFAGDERESMYAKYYARKRGVRRLIGEVEPDSLIPASAQLELAISSEWDVVGFTYFASAQREAEGQFIHSAAAALAGSVDPAEVTGRTVGRAERSVLSELYMKFLIENGAGNKQLAVASIAMNPLNRDFALIQGCADEDAYSVEVARLEDAIRDLSSRAAEFGVAVASDIRGYGVPEVDFLAGRMSHVEDGHMRNSLGQSHTQMMQDCYIHARDVGAALQHRDWSVHFRPDPQLPHEINSLAYMFLASRDVEKAEALLLAGVNFREETIEASLIAMNLGVAKLLLGDPEAAVEQFSRAAEIGGELEPEDQKAACLLVPRLISGCIEIEEKWAPNVVIESRNGIEVARALKLVTQVRPVDAVNDYENEEGGSLGCAGKDAIAEQ